MDSNIFKLREQFDAAIARARWTMGWIPPWTAEHLRRGLQKMCASAERGSCEGLAALATRMLQELSPPPMRGRSPYISRCPLAAALEAGNGELAEEMWRQAPRKWWRDGEALLGEARRIIRNEEWIDRLIPCWEPPRSPSLWHSGAHRRVGIEVLAIGALGHFAINDRSAHPEKAEKRWADTLARLERCPILAESLAMMCVMRGGENEDWGLMAIKKAWSQRGALFAKCLSLSNSPARMPISKPWSEEGVAMLARGAKRADLLVGLALPEPDAAYRRAAKAELERRGALGLERGAATAATKVIQHYEAVLISCRRVGMDAWAAKAWRDEALSYFSQTDLLRTGARLARRSFWAMRGNAWTGNLQLQSSGGSGGLLTKEDGMADSLGAIAKRLSNEQAMRLRRKAGMADGVFDRHFETLNARLLAEEIGEACGLKTAGERQARGRKRL